MSGINYSISLLIFAIWIYSIGLYGQRKIKQMGLPSIDSKFFKLNILAIPILSIVPICIRYLQHKHYMSEFKFQSILMYVVAFYIFFALFQTVIYASKTIAILEIKRNVTVKDYFWDFILFTFLLGGIWILQPKITRLIASKKK